MSTDASYSVRIGNRQIVRDEPPWIVAEMSGNHNQPDNIASQTAFTISGFRGTCREYEASVRGPEICSP